MTADQKAAKTELEALDINDVIGMPTPDASVLTSSVNEPTLSTNEAGVQVEVTT